MDGSLSGVSESTTEHKSDFPFIYMGKYLQSKQHSVNKRFFKPTVRSCKRIFDKLV